MQWSCGDGNLLRDTTAQFLFNQRITVAGGVTLILQRVQRRVQVFRLLEPFIQGPQDFKEAGHQKGSLE